MQINSSNPATPTNKIEAFRIAGGFFRSWGEPKLFELAPGTKKSSL
jgi:hypothetical protein